MEEVQTTEETPVVEPEETAVEETPQVETPEKPTEPEVDYKQKFIDSQREAIRLAKENESLKAQPKPEEKPQEKDDIDVKIEQKVREAIAPITEQQVKDKIDTWFKDNPGAIDYLKEIEESYPNSPGKDITAKLENAFVIAKKDAMKEAGKKEFAFELHQKQQAASSGGDSVMTNQDSSLPVLTKEEKEVARKMGITEEAYAKNKVK